MLPTNAFTKLFIALAIALLAACGGSSGNGSGSNDDSTTPIDPTIVRIEIVQAAVLLTTPGETALLSAQAYNAADIPVNAVFTWKASSPNNVAVVMDTGEVTAHIPGGSVITASAANITSNPVIALHAAPVADAMLVSDAQIVRKPTAVDPNAAGTVGDLFVVTISGTNPPALGTILMGRGSIPLAGRVVSSQAVIDGNEVTLEIVPINEIFDNLVFNEVIDLTQTKMIASPAALEYYTVTKRADGSYVFELRPDAVDPITGGFVAQKQASTNSAGRHYAAAAGTFANPTHPFVCDTSGPSFNSGTGNQIISLSPVGSITINPNPQLIFSYDESQGGLQKIGLSTAVSIESEIKFTVAASFEGKIDCKLELLKPNILLPGPLTFFIGIQLPIGIGVELAGKITVADTGLTIKTTAVASLTGVLNCPSGVCGDIEGDASATGSVEPTINFPPGIGSGVLTGLRFEPSLSGYGYLDVSVGPPLFSTAQVTLVGNKVGMAQKANLTFVEIQIADTAYQSDYKLEMNASTTLGSGIASALSLFGVTPFTAPKFELAIPLRSSPSATKLEADVDNFVTGDLVKFDISLNPESVEYIPFIYNIDKILIYHRVVDPVFGDSVSQVASISAADGQTDFVTTWTADSAGTVSDNFFVFVDTTLLPLPLLGELELGKVNGLALPGNYEILFTRRDGGGTFYAVNADGSNLQNLNTRAGNDVFWSPDGAKVVFSAVPVGGSFSDIHVMNANGTNRQNLTNSPSSLEGLPLWSPDGTKIVFSQFTVGQGLSEIYVMNADGSNPQNLTNTADAFSINNAHSWSPDSSKITFTSFRDGGDDVFVMNANGSSSQNLTSVLHDAHFPLWSPDGTKIAFIRFNTAPGIYVMNADGTNKQNLTNGGNISLPDFQHSWSPDSTKLVFVSARDGAQQIFSVNTDGSNLKNLSNNPANEGSPSWSPDGSKIVFVSERDGNIEIYVMNADGSNQKNLSNSPTIDTDPTWSP